MTSILTNVAALAATRQLGLTNMGLKGTIERLTTGRRINRASDDAAGLSNATSRQLEAIQARESRRTNNQTFFAEQAKDGYLEEATNLVMRAMELVAGGNSSSSELTKVNTLAVAAALKAGVTLTSPGTTTTDVTTALGTINTNRGTIAGNMAEAASNANLYGIEAENKTAQAGNIMDADVGEEVVKLTKWQILSQSGISALSQANQASQNVVGLLR